MPPLRYFLLKLKAMKKLTILGVVFLTFSVIALSDISHMLLVDILSDTPTETVESIPVIEPVIETPVDTNVVATDETVSMSLAEEIIPATGDIPTETSTIPIVDAEPATPAVVIPDCEPEVTPVVAPVVAVEPAEKLAAEIIIPVETSLEAPATEIPTPIDVPVIVATPEIPAEAVVPAETPTVEVTTPVEVPTEIPAVVAPVEEITAPTVPVCIPKQTASIPEPIEETPIKKIVPEVPFVDLYVPELTTEEKVIIDSTAVQSCNAESFVTEIQGGHSQIIPLFLQGSGSSDNSVKIGDVPKGSILTFVANGLTEITGINFDNLMISADIAPDAQKGSFNVPIIYSTTSKNEVSNAMCQLNLVIQ